MYRFCNILFRILLVSYLINDAVSRSHVRKLTEMPKILIYITTHMSKHHKDFLQYCWPLALKNSKLLKNSDIMIYMTPEAGDISGSVALVKETFKDQNLYYHIRSNPGYQQGANAALNDASKHGWFDGYDWVIRLNPDVLIQNDNWILDTIQNDENASLLYVKCVNRLKTLKFHTDFFGLNLGALPQGFKFDLHRNAEKSFSKIVKKIISSEQYRHVPDSYPARRGACRVDGNRSGPVFHFHFVQVENGNCPASFY